METKREKKNEITKKKKMRDGEFGPNLSLGSRQKPARTKFFLRFGNQASDEESRSFAAELCLPSESSGRRPQLLPTGDDGRLNFP